MSLFACQSIHQGLDPQRFSDESRGRPRRPEIFYFILVWLLYFPIREYKQEVRGYRSNPPSWRKYFLCRFSRIDLPGKNSPVRSKLPTLAC